MLGKRPTRNGLAARWARRAADGEDDLQRRLAAARAEIDAAAEFDHVLVNHEGAEEATVEAFLALVASERARPGRPAPLV